MSIGKNCLLPHQEALVSVEDRVAANTQLTEQRSYNEVYTGVWSLFSGYNVLSFVFFCLVNVLVDPHSFQPSPFIIPPTSSSQFEITNNDPLNFIIIKWKMSVRGKDPISQTSTNAGDHRWSPIVTDEQPKWVSEGMSILKKYIFLKKAFKNILL